MLGVLKSFLYKAFVFLTGAILSACALTAPQAFYERAPEKWTHEQKMVAFFHAFKQETTSEDVNGYSVKRNLLKIRDVYDLVTRIRNDLNWALQNPDFVDYLLWTGSGPYLADIDKQWDMLFKCLKAYDINGQLAYVLGIVTEQPNPEYSTKLVVSCPNLSKVLKFSDERIEKAKEEGRLIPSQIAKVEVADPTGSVTLEALTYIIVPDSPSNEEESVSMWYRPGIYAEIKREGENVPIARLYRSVDSENLNIALVDYDNQTDYGYGLPDDILRVSVSSALEFLSLKVKDLIPREKSIFSVYKYKRTEASPETVYIVRPGQVQVEKWEDGEFEVPIDYSSSGYDVDFKLKTEEKAKDGSVRVEYLYAKYTSVGVVEIYTPKKEYAWVKDIYISGNLLRLTFTDKPAIEAPPKTLGTLTYVVYKEGDKGIMLWDSNGDGKFDKRRVVNWNW